MRALLSCIQISMHNTTVLALAHRMIDGIHHTFTIRCVHYCIYLSLGMHCARYGAREGRARSEMGEALPGFCRRTYMPVANRFSQAASYTRTWRHGDMLSYSRKIKLTSRLVHRHVLGYVGQSAWRVSVLQQNARIATHRRIPYNIIEARALENLHCQQRIRGLDEHAMSSVDQFGAVAISLERTTRHLTGVFGMRVRSSRCPAVRAICQVSIPHVRAR